MRSNLSKPKPKHKVTKFQFEAIGTDWFIELACSEAVAEGVIIKIRDRIRAFDMIYSRFRSDSLVAQMSQKSGKYHLPDDAKPMMDLYYELYRLTNGSMTPLIEQVLVDAGYDAHYSLQPKNPKVAPKLEDAVIYDFPIMTLKIPLLFDFGAIGKGYLIDLVSEVIKDQNIADYVINAGGDVVHAGSAPTEIGLEHPMNADEVIGIVALDNMSVCGSATNRRKWAGYHHIIDPKTLHSTSGILAVWVCAKSALVADALSTALFFATPDMLYPQFDFDYAIVNADQSLCYSQGFPAQFFEASN